MKKRLSTGLIVLALFIALPMAGHSQWRFFQPELTVNPISSTTFEVIQAYGEGPSGIWCAAARYASGTLGKTRGRIYVEKPRGPSVTQKGTMGVVFSTQPIPGIDGRATNSISERGANLLVGHALQFCRDYIIEPNDLF